MPSPENDAAARLVLEPIGFVRNALATKVEAARQPQAAQGEPARIELLPGRNFEHALEDLARWKRIWVLFWFHHNAGWRPKVLPPRSVTGRKGVFATRSPHRPNPLGMSVVRLERVDGLTLHILDSDMLDGTPVLDIKPYVAYTDAHADAGNGWLDDTQAASRGAESASHGAEVMSRGTERMSHGAEPMSHGAEPMSHGAAVASRGAERPADPVPAYDVRFEALAAEQAMWIEARTALAIEERIRSTLALGPAPHPYRRIRRLDDGMQLAVKEWRVRFSVEGREVRVVRIASGFRVSQLAGDGIDDVLRAHREFRERWS